MAKLYNLARVNTATVGLGNVTLGAAISGYLTWMLAGIQNGDVVSYALHDFTAGVLTASEAGRGTYTAATNSFSRDTVLDSTNGGAKIPLSGSAQAIITVLAEDIATLDGVLNIGLNADLLDGFHASSFQAALGYTPLNPANNLADVGNVATARTNLGLGAAALLAVPITAANGGTGVANDALATLTLPNAATTISTGGTLALGGFTLTVPATGTAALLQAANVFTATQAIQGTVPALQFLDTTASAKNAGIFVDGNILYFTEGILTNGTGTVFSIALGASPYLTTFQGNFTVDGGSNKKIEVFGSTPVINVKNSSGVIVIKLTGEGFENSYLNTGLISKYGIGTSSPVTRLHVLADTATRNVPLDSLRVEAFVYSGGLGAQNGFGVGIPFFAETATDGTNQQQALIATSYIDSTNATRKSKISFSVYDTAARLGIEIEASGTVAKLGFYGATTIVQPANTTDLRTAIVNLGLLASGGATPLDLNGGAISNATKKDSGIHQSLSITYIDGTGTAGVDTTAQTVKTLTLPANSMTQVGDRIRIRAYWRGDTGTAIVGAVLVGPAASEVLVGDTTDIGGSSQFVTEVWMHYIDNTHANIIESESGALGALTANNVAGFTWNASQAIIFTQSNALNNHCVLFAFIVDRFPKGI